MECVISMLVKRRGILWTAMPTQFSIPKVIAIVGAFTKHHNSCIDIDTKKVCKDTFLDLGVDQVDITTNESSYVMMELDKESNEKLCKDLMSGCNHFYDIPNKIYHHH